MTCPPPFVGGGHARLASDPYGAPMSRPSRTAPVLIAVAVASASSWFAWLGWEAGYRTLPDGTCRDRIRRRKWSACAVTVAAIVVAGCLALRCARGKRCRSRLVRRAPSRRCGHGTRRPRDETDCGSVGLAFLVVGAVAGFGRRRVTDSAGRGDAVRNRSRTRLSEHPVGVRPDCCFRTWVKGAGSRVVLSVDREEVRPDDRGVERTHPASDLSKHSEW